MADTGGQGSDEVARLEAALDRIVHAGIHRPAPGPAPVVAQENTELAGRLDALIAEIRAALGRESAD